MFRTLRPLSSFSRHFSSSRALFIRHDGPVTIQRVRFSRPIFTTKRAQSIIINVVVFGLMWHFIIADDGEEDEKDATQAANVGRKEEQATETDGEAAEDEEQAEDEVQIPDTIPEDAFFIPLGFAHQRPATFYRGSDPEWQSFLDFSHDRRRSLAIKNELAGLVGQHTSSMRGFQKMLGKPIKVDKYWLDVDFPDGPPPEYERGGLEISGDYIAWTTRPVSPLQFSRLQTALWPTSMASSLWAIPASMWSMQMARVKELLGVKSEPQKPDPNAPTGFIDFQRFAKASSKQESHPGAGADKISEPKSSDMISTKASSKAVLSDAARVLPPLPSIPQPGGGMTSAVTAFKRTLAKTWQPASIPPERGTFIVSGLVELTGSKAICVLDVHAAYHPRESRWVVVSIGVRRVQARKQSPKGGA